jgi:FkbM family methyltransferase
LPASLASDGCVHAFQPVPQNFGFLKHNIEKNGVKNCHQSIAASSPSPEADLPLRREFAGGSFLTSCDVSDPREKLIEVDCLTLDAYCDKALIQRLDLISWMSRERKRTFC